MNVLLFLEHFFIKKDGKLYCEKVITNEYLKRYLEVFDNVTICARINSELTEYITDPLINVNIIGLPNYNSNKLLLNLNKLIRKNDTELKKYDAIIIRAPSSISVLGYKIAKKYKTSFIAEIVINPESLFSYKCHYLKKIINSIGRNILIAHTKSLCKNSNGVSYVTKELLQNKFPSRARIYGESEYYFETYYSSINLKDEDYSNQILEYDNKFPFVICHTGWMVGDNKGHKVAMESVKKLIDFGFNIKLKFIGDGPKKNEFMDYAKKLGINESVFFVGKLNNFSDIQKELNSSHLFLFPSVMEGLPRSVIEAMANSLPCIASNIDGIPELLPENMLFNPNDVNKIVAIIEKLILDEDFRLIQARNNYIESKNYHIDVLAPRRKEFYQKLYYLVEKEKCK